MPNFFPRRPFFGSTDWAARQFLGLLDQEEREKAELSQLQETGWRPDSELPPPPPEPGPRFGDGRDALADLVQANLDHRQALRDEARRRVVAQLAQAQPDAPFIPPHKPDLRGAPQAQPPALPIPPQKPASVPQATTPPWRQDPRAERIIEEIIDTEIIPGVRTSWNDPRGGFTNYGLRQIMLDAWHKAHPGNTGSASHQVPRDARNLTRDQAFRVLKEDYYDKFGLPDVTDEVLAHQLADMYVNHGFGNASKIVQRAVDDVMRSHDLYEGGRLPPSRGYEWKDATGKDMAMPPTPVGPKTRRRLNMLIERGYGPELRNALVDQRQKFIADGPADYADPLIERAGRFRERRHPQTFGAND